MIILFKWNFNGKNHEIVMCPAQTLIGTREKNVKTVNIPPKSGRLATLGFTFGLVFPSRVLFADHCYVNLHINDENFRFFFPDSQKE